VVGHFLVDRGLLDQFLVDRGLLDQFLVDRDCSIKMAITQFLLSRS
jgi:hypothetical protein